MGVVTDVLPKWERLLYTIGGIGVELFVIFSLYRESRDKFEVLDLEPGLRSLGGWKDAPDWEWDNDMRHSTILLPLLVGHFLIGQILFALKLSIWLQKLIRLLYDVLAVTMFFGIRATLLFTIESLVMYLTTFQHRLAVVWLVSLSLTTTLNMKWMINKQLNITNMMDDSITYFISLSYVHIRLISFCIEVIKQKNSNKNSNTTDKKQNEETKMKGEKNDHLIVESTFIDFMSYIFHIPIYFFGPIINYNEFLLQLTTFYQSPKHNYDFKDIVNRILRIALVAALIELLSHFLYVTAIGTDVSVVESLSIPSTIGLAVWQGHFFHLKYVCLFGIGSLAALLDGLTPPPSPACISWVYSFTDMWKYFDVGLYNFIKRYIYIPLGGSRDGHLRQIFGSLLSFAYIFYWHGIEPGHLVWCLGNAIVIILEISAIRLEHSEIGSYLKTKLGLAGFQRLKGFLTVPPYLSSSLQVMFFFFSYDIGCVLVDTLVTKASWTGLILEYIGFYLAIQNAMYVRKWLVEMKWIK